MREFNSSFSKSQKLLLEYQKGVMAYKYRGIPCLKSPFDIAIYMRLLHDLKPKTIIEIGSKFRGSALLFKDLLSNIFSDFHIWSYDIRPVENLEIERVSFLYVDINNLEVYLTEQFWKKVKRPILVVEDSSHQFDSCLKCLYFFEQKLNKGEILILEDGILNWLGLSEQYSGGPNEAISTYFSQNHGFSIIKEYCNLFGYNNTYDPNAYLVKLDTCD